MNLIFQAFGWIFDPAHWVTTNSFNSIPDSFLSTLELAGLSLLVTVIIALPLGLAIGHTGRGRFVAILFSNIARALPTLGILAALILALGVGILPAVIVLVVLGIPPLLAGAYSGLESVDRQTIDAARAIGMSEWQVLFKVEIPLGAALLLGGFRATTLQIIATVIVASTFGQNSLGSYIVNGVSSADYVQMTAGAILVIVLCLVVDGLLALVQRFVVPRESSRGSSKKRNTTARGEALGLGVSPGRPLKEGN